MEQNITFDEATIYDELSGYLWAWYAYVPRTKSRIAEHGIFISPDEDHAREYIEAIRKRWSDSKIVFFNIKDRYIESLAEETGKKIFSFNFLEGSEGNMDLRRKELTKQEIYELIPFAYGPSSMSGDVI